VQLEDLVPEDHPLRKIRPLVDTRRLRFETLFDDTVRRAASKNTGRMKITRCPKPHSLALKAIKAMKMAVAEVRREHRLRGEPLVVWKNGKAAGLLTGRMTTASRSSR
jgi:hypothetical protein